MPYKYKRTCPICQRPGLSQLNAHLRQVHGLEATERQKWLKEAAVDMPSDTNIVPKDNNLRTTVTPTEPSRIIKFTLKHPFTMVIAAPTGFGKTLFMRKVLEQADRLIEMPPQSIIWCYSQ